MTTYRKGANSRDGTPADRRSGGKNTGAADFSGQESRDEPQGGTTESEAREGIGGAKINFQRQHGKSNGSRGTVRVIAPGSVRGSNR